MKYAIWNKLTTIGQAAFGKHAWLNKNVTLHQADFLHKLVTATLNKFLRS